MFSKTQLVKMLELQNGINVKVNPDWKNAGNDWALASMMEAVEAIGHHGWKWWKKQTPDYDQLRMELVDIWHFMLSDILVVGKHDSIADLSQDFFDVIEDETNKKVKAITFNGLNYDLSEISLMDKLKLFVGTSATGHTPINLFYSIMESTGLTHADLYQQYLGKNVLNFFRQNHGYKDGSYIKIWFDGREDNEHLTEIMSFLDMENPNIDNILYSELEKRYSDNV